MLRLRNFWPATIMSVDMKFEIASGQGSFPLNNYRKYKRFKEKLKKYFWGDKFKFFLAKMNKVTMGQFWVQSTNALHASVVCLVALSSHHENSLRLTYLLSNERSYGQSWALLEPSCSDNHLPNLRRWVQRNEWTYLKT